MIEAFSRMISAKPRLVKNGFKTYLYKTARNLALRHAEKRRRHCFFSFEGLEDELESEMLVEAVLQSEEKIRILRKCMKQLDPDCCEALYLLYFEDMSYLEIAQVMRKSRKQIDHLLERGRKRLRPLLEREGITGANG